MSVIFDRSQFATNSGLRYVAYGVAALVLTALHVVVLRYISVSSVTPDLLLVLIVYIALAEGQFIGLFAGFFSGLVFDAVSADVLGTNALAKTVAAFIAGYFVREGMAISIVGSYRFLLVVGLCGFVHNILYFFFFVRPMQTSFTEFFLTYGIATTLYTTVAAVFPMLIVSRRKEW